MKHLLALIILFTLATTVHAQNRFPYCTPSKTTISVNGQLVESNSNCVAVSRVSESGYVPIGSTVTFEYRDASRTGIITGTQWTWGADNTTTVEYMVAYVDTAKMPLFLVAEVAVTVDKVH